MNREQMSQIASQIHQLTGKVSQLQVSVDVGLNSVRTDLTREFAVSNQNINRVAIQPARRINRAAAGGGGDVAQGNVPAPPPVVGDAGIVELSKSPKHLAELWYEFTVGLGGRKPARDFTYQERGASKSRYSRRKLVWDLIQGLILQGHSHTAAINKIYNTYGRGLSVSKIIECIRRDKRTGGHPNLRIAAVPIPRGQMPRAGPDAVAGRVGQEAGGGRRAAPRVPRAPVAAGRINQHFLPFAGGDGRGPGRGGPGRGHGRGGAPRRQPTQRQLNAVGRHMDFGIGNLAAANVGGAHIDFGPPVANPGPQVDFGGTGAV